MRQQVLEAIESARLNLDQALAGLEQVPETEAEIVGYTAHKLKNYLAVVGATADLLEVYFAGHPDEQVRVWVEGLQHAVQLMNHEAGRLMSSAHGRSAAFRFEKVDVGLLVFRACNFYRRKSAWKNMQLSTDVRPDCCFARADRVALAAVMDNLLSNAFKFSRKGSRI
ncbi:MAG TPA: hypothetical protein VMJ30_09090, partial [Gemmatimonadales bacterium]|nr:hypothetical protein [Gemmatimonadales bacterium]